MEAKAKKELRNGTQLTSASGFQTILDYFETWIVGGTSKASPGWKRDQVQLYKDYVHPIIGNKPIYRVKSADIARVIADATALGRSPQTCRHIYNLMHKMFRDAVESYEILGRNPVRKEFKPSIPKKEAIYLFIQEAAKLLKHVHDKPRPYQVVIWLQLYVGMRVAEVQSLKCGDIDLNRRVILIRSTYVRKEKRIQDHPKGKEWHSVKMPPELYDLITEAMQGRNADDFVASHDGKKMLSYDYYLKMLKQYCEECGVRKVATHALRHSTSEIYRAHGATRDDIYKLFKHSSIEVTERYMHDKGDSVHKIADVIRIFGKPNLDGSKASNFWLF